MNEVIAWDALACVRGRIDRSEAVVHIVATKAREEALFPRPQKS